MYVTKRDGSKRVLDLNKIHAVLIWACEGMNDDALTAIKGVSVSQIEMRAHLHFYDGMPTKAIHELLIKAAAELISEDFPNYDHVAARLVWFAVRKEAFRNNLPLHLKDVIDNNIKLGVYTKDITNLYNPEEINELNSMIDHKRDDLFRYAGAEQMRKKYLVQNRKSKTVFESFQFPYILVAALLFAKYPKNTRMKYVKKYYDLISQHFISLPTPIMAGLRTKIKQFSSCTLIESGDSLKSINSAAAAIVDYASRKAGIGLSIGEIRAQGQIVRNGDAVTTGVVPFAKYFNAALKSCSQGSVRGASATFNYPIWHLEFETLIELKNNKGTDETRLRTVDYCVHLNNLFYERLANKSHITFFSPEEVPDLYQSFYSSDLKEFEKLYKFYEKDSTKTKKTLPALEVFTKLIQERFETGRIYILNADHVNTHGSFYEPIKMTNLCLTGDTRIVTSNGLKTLKELYISQENFSVSSDVRAIEEQILQYGNSNQFKKTTKSLSFGVSSFNSSKVFMTNPNAEVFEVQTASGYSIKGTSDHKIMTSEGWKNIGSLNSQDHLYIQSGKGLFNKELKLNNLNCHASLNIPEYANEELGEFVGWLFKNGSVDINTNWTYLKFENNNDYLISKFEKYIKNILPNVNISYDINENLTQLIIKDTRFGFWLNSLGLQENSIPSFIWNSNKFTIAGFLRSVFSEQNLSSNSNICLSNINNKTLKDISILLSNFGIKSSICVRNNNGFKITSDIISNENNCELTISNNNSIIYKQEIGFLVNSNKIISINKAKLNSISYENYEDRVVSVKSIGFEPVYDITVNTSHSFIANSIVVHNCTEITLPTMPMGKDDSLIALCTLSAINWGKFTPFGELDSESSAPARQDQKLKDTCEMAVRGLDALLDYQEYPLEEAKKHTMMYRPLGIGIIGFAHWLAKGKLYWGESDTLIEVEKMMEKIAYYLTDTSIELAKDLGACRKTKYHDGIFPIDTSIIKAKTELDWHLLKNKAKKYGIRNATLMAGMPSETSSQLANETNGFEPPRDMISIKGSKEGVLPQIVPEYNRLAAHYQTLWQVKTKDYLRTTAILQKYMDQAMSINTSYDASKTEIRISELLEDLLYSYKLGHKTLYYCNVNDGGGEDSSEDDCESGACKI